jgi:hypothetical protein
MVFRPDPGPEAASVNSSFERIPEPSVPEAPMIDPALLATRAQLVRDIGRSRFRRWIWISLASAEAVFFLVAIFKMQ